MTVQKGAKAEVDEQEDRGRQVEQAVDVEEPARVAGEVDGGHGRYAVVAAEVGHAQLVLRACRAADEIEQDEGHHERDHAQVHVAQAGEEQEVSEERREGCRQGDRQNDGNRAVAQVDCGKRVAVPAESEECRLPEADDAAVAPHEGQAEGQDRHDDVDRDIEEVREIEQRRRTDQGRQARECHHDQPGRIGVRLHIPLLNQRPEMPSGMNRNRMMADASSATSPMTGVDANVTSW